MRTSRIAFLAFVALNLSIISDSFSQSTPWTSLNTGLYGGNITSIYAFGSALYAGTFNDGVYVSTNNGATWKSTNTGLPTQTYVTSITSIGSKLYVGLFTGGVYVSSDNGASWTSAEGVSTYEQVTALFTVADSLYVGTVGGITLSTDFGNTSTDISAGLPSGTFGHAQVNNFAKKGNCVFAGSFYNGLYRSINNGNWTLLNNGIPSGASIGAILVKGVSIIVGTDAGLYISNDNGDSWTSYSYGLPTTQLYSNALAYYNGKIFLATYGGIYWSSNNGSTWQLATTGTGLYFTDSINALCVSGSSLYAGTTISGIITSANGTTWTKTNSGLTNENISAIVKKDGNLFAGTNYGGLFKSQDGGNNWTKLKDQISYSSLTSLAVKGDSLLSTSGNGVFLSTNNGLDWTSMNLNLTSSSTNVSCLIIYNNKIIIGTYGGIYEYNQAGHQWVLSNGDLPSDKYAYQFFAKDNIILAVMYNSGLYRSQDGGSTWTAVNLGSFGISNFTSSGKYITGTSNTNTYLSADNGLTWQSISSSNTHPLFASTSVDSSYVFFGGYGGMNFSTDHGSTIAPCNNGLPTTAEVICLMRNGDYILAGTTEGIWSIPITSFSPSITSFSPASGSPGTVVTITGTNFDHLPDYDSVKFNGTHAEVVSATSTSLTVVVPEGTSKGPITVTIEGRTAVSSTDFCVGAPKPVISASDLNTNAPTLASSSDTGNQWYLNGDQIEDTESILHPTQSGSYTVQVTLNGCASTLSDAVSVAIFTPTLTSFSPASGSPGTLVTISGTNFSHAPDSVKFNGVNAAITSISSTTLKAIVPEGASKGPITIIIDGRTAISLVDFCVGPPKPAISVAGSDSMSPTLTSSSNNGNQWYLNSTEPVGTDSVLSVTQSGTYTVQVTANGCASSLSDEVTITISTIAANAPTTNKDVDLSIYPVPAKDRVIINLDQFNQNQDVSVSVYNSFGQKVFISETINTGNLPVEVSQYTSGLYIVKVLQGTKQSVGKFTKI